MSLLFNMPSKLVITFLPRSKCLLISWLQPPSGVILEPPKIKSVSVSSASPSICHEVMGPVKKAVAPHSSTLSWKIPWTEEPGGLQSMESLRVGHDWATSLSCIGEENGNLLQCSCLENPRDREAWWSAIYGVTHSRTWLKWLSSSSSSKGPDAMILVFWMLSLKQNRLVPIWERSTSRLYIVTLLI